MNIYCLLVPMGSIRDIDQIRCSFCPKGAHSLGQGFSNGAVLLPKGYLATSGDTTKIWSKVSTVPKLRKPDPPGEILKWTTEKLCSCNLQAWIPKGLFRGVDGCLSWLLKASQRREGGWEGRGNSKGSGRERWHSLRSTRTDEWLWMASLETAAWVRCRARPEGQPGVWWVRVLGAKLRDAIFEQCGESLMGF